MRRGERDFREKMCINASLVKMHHLSICHHFLGKNVVVVVDQAESLTFIVITRDDRMSTQIDSRCNPTNKNYKPPLICLFVTKALQIVH